jgi:hypothetical protein
VWGAPESPELALGTDELSTWAAARARLFLPVDEACGPSLAVISARAGSGHSRKDANVFLGAADFQLVAYGRARNLKIVTLEIPRRNQNGKVKIPDACQAHGAYLAFLNLLGDTPSPAPVSPAPAPTQTPSGPSTSRLGFSTTGEPSGTGASSGSEPSTELSPQPESPGGSASRGANHPDTKDTLDLSGLDVASAPSNLKYRYHELGRISLKDFPISAAILMRSVLESTVKIHFEGTSTPVSGMLKDVFNQVYQSYGKNKALKAPINFIRSGNAQKYGSIEWFNHIAHSADATVSGDDVRQAWKVVNPLLRHLLLSQASAAPATP